MTVTGEISDISTGEALNGTTVMVVDNDGKPLGGATVADVTGNFSIASPILDNGGKLMISHVGYQSVIADPSVFNESGGLGLERATDSMQAAVVTAKAPSKNLTPLLLVGGAGLALMLLSGKRKKESVGAFDFDWTKLILPAVLVGGGYWIYTKIKPGPTGTTSNNAITDSNTANAADEAVKKAQAAGIVQTLDDNTINSLANTLYQQLAPISDQDPVDQTAVRNNVIRVNTQLDWSKLVQSFGSRKFNTGGAFSICSWTGLQCTSLDLGAALKLALDTSHISDINTFFAGQNIPVVL